jgi:hypothetical protein
MAGDNREPFENELLNQHMDSLAQEIASLKRDDPRRAEIVKEVLRLAGLSRSLKGESNKQ